MKYIHLHILSFIFIISLVSCTKEEYMQDPASISYTTTLSETGTPTPFLLYDNVHLFLDATQPGAISYQWLPTGETTSVIEFIPNDYCPSEWYSLKPDEYLGGYEVMVTFPDTTVKYSFSANYEESIVYCPNAFTPNGDAINDHWTIFYDHRAVDIKSCNIYNEYGKKVYQSDDGECPLWDGMYNGIAANIGNYTFIIHYINPYGAKMSREGVIQIMK